MAIGDIIVGLDLGATKISCVIGQVNKFSEIEVIGYGLSDSSGIKTGIIAEEGENLDILVNGSKGYQKLKTISVTKGIENSCISVPLGLVSVKLKIHDSKGKILKNNKIFLPLPHCSNVDFISPDLYKKHMDSYYDPYINILIQLFV